MKNLQEILEKVYNVLSSDALSSNKIFYRSYQNKEFIGLDGKSIISSRFDYNINNSDIVAIYEGLRFYLGLDILDVKLIKTNVIVEYKFYWLSLWYTNKIFQPIYRYDYEILVTFGDYKETFDVNKDDMLLYIKLCNLIDEKKKVENTNKIDISKKLLEDKLK